MIETDLLTGTFDTTLTSYRDFGSRVEEHQGQQSHHKRNSPAPEDVHVDFVKQFELWTRQIRNMDCEVNVDYNATRNMLIRWGCTKDDMVVSKLSEEAFCATTYNKRLGMLKLFYAWLVRNGTVPTNPFNEVIRRRVRKNGTSPGKLKRAPFTPAEITDILRAFREDSFCTCSNYKHSFYYAFLYFIFRTGVRNGEAIGLQVKHVHVEKGIIEISETLSRTIKGYNAANRRRKETKNDKVRYLPLTSDLHELLASRVSGRHPDELVFPSPKGLCIDDQMFQKRIFKKVLEKLQIAPRVLYACRHTFGTRCIEGGLDPLKTSMLMGNNPETVLRNYVHPVALPDTLPTIR